VGEQTKHRLHRVRAGLDPLAPAQDIETRLEEIFAIAERLEEDGQDEIERALAHPPGGAAGASAKSPPSHENQTRHRVS
jgi:hypothetical protein